ncbi:hypothetical protein BH10ACI2_BH10ACI2_02320 [soil metagenome]
MRRDKVCLIIILAKDPYVAKWFSLMWAGSLEFELHENSSIDRMYGGKRELIWVMHI